MSPRILAATLLALTTVAVRAQPVVASRGAADTMTTVSGLRYFFLRNGNGPKPQTGDLMIIHGLGVTSKGSEFWNTMAPAEPFEYTLGVDGVIKGFAEAMRDLVREGDRLMIVMTPELGYGDRERPNMPPNSTLVFDYEITKVVHHSLAGLLRDGFAATDVDRTLATARTRPDLKDYYASDASIIQLANRTGRSAPADAEKILSFGLTVLPESYRLYQALARGQAARGASSEAIRSYEAALRRNPRQTAAERADYDTATAAVAALRPARAAACSLSPNLSRSIR